MNINKMVAPGQRRPTAWRGGIIQIHLTRACDRACSNCTQGSQFKGKATFITLENFEIAVKTLIDYFGVVGIFGGNPALHPQFEDICNILATHIPWERRGLWCNNPMNHAKLMARTFNPSVSNLNVHQDRDAFMAFKKDWPNAKVFGLEKDSVHAPVHYIPTLPREQLEPLIERCDINRYWSAMMGQFRNEVRAWFCEIAGGQAMLQQDNPEYPDTGLLPERGWWQRPMQDFADQVKYHCFKCGVPMRGAPRPSNANITDLNGYKFDVKKGEVVTYDIKPTKHVVVDYA